MMQVLKWLVASVCVAGLADAARADDDTAIAREALQVRGIVCEVAGARAVDEGGEGRTEFVTVNVLCTNGQVYEVVKGRGWTLVHQWNRLKQSWDYDDPMGPGGRQ
jgi:hypothetical protein